MSNKAGLFLLALLMTARLTAAAPHADVASLDWSVNAPHSLAKNPPPQEAVWDFVNGFSDDAFTGGELCSFRFVDLRHTGELSLVAVYYGGGTGGCNLFTVFDKGPLGIEAYNFRGGLTFTSVADAVKDIKSDGQFELVVPFGGASYCNYDWPSVYAWTGNGYTNVSSQYPKYYQNWLASLKKQIATMDHERETGRAPAGPAAEGGPAYSAHAGYWQSGPGSSPTAAFATAQAAAEAPSPTAPETDAPTAQQVDCARAQAAKVERFLGAKDVGMVDAIRWANSGDPKQRTFAARVFADMGTAETLRYEQTLSRDSDPEVAKLAHRKLKSWGRTDPYYAGTFDRETPGD